jgi:hypothetical protein
MSIQLHFQQEVRDISTDGGETWVPIIGGSATSAPAAESQTGGEAWPLYLRTTNEEVICLIAEGCKLYGIN